MVTHFFTPLHLIDGQSAILLILWGIVVVDMIWEIIMMQTNTVGATELTLQMSSTDDQ